MRETIRKIVGEMLEQSGDRDPFGDTDSLIHSGRLSSVSVVEMAVKLEESFGISFSEGPFDPDRLDSISAMKDLIQEQTGN